MGNKGYKKETINKIKKVVIIILVLIIIYTAYSMGTMKGFVFGTSLALQRNNETICDLINKTRDVDGFCLLREKEYKYRWHLDCGWEKFKIKGERNPPLLLKISEDIRRILMYPAMNC